MREMYEVIIIGGGPAGCAAAIYSARSRLKTLVLDKGFSEGALAWAPRIANYPGVQGEVSGRQLLSVMMRQAEGFGAEFLQEKVLGAELEKTPKEIFTAQGSYWGRSVIVATGSMGRLERVPGEEEFLGRGVSYCATCDGAFFRGEEVALAGEGDHALEEALALCQHAERVYLLIPGQEIKGGRELRQRILDQPKIEVRRQTRLVSVHGQGQVEAIRIATPEGERDLPAKGIFIFLKGRSPEVEFLGGALQRGELGCLQVNRQMETDIPGVFAAGDVLCRELKQAVVAAAEGSLAALSALRYLQRSEAGSR
jgi:thioredoxin reductase (NADPH)